MPSTCKCIPQSVETYIRIINLKEKMSTDEIEILSKNLNGMVKIYQVVLFKTLQNVTSTRMETELGTTNMKHKLEVNGITLFGQPLYIKVIQVSK